MVASTGRTGRGVQFQIGQGGPPVVYTGIGNARSVNLTGREADEVDFTHLLSSGAFREFRQGFKDPGSISIEYQFDPNDASHVLLATLFTSGATFPWKINLANIDTSWNFSLKGNGYVSNPGDFNFTVDDPVSGTATIRITGQTTLEANT